MRREHELRHGGGNAADPATRSELVSVYRPGSNHLQRQVIVCRPDINVAQDMLSDVACGGLRSAMQRQPTSSTHSPSPIVLCGERLCGKHDAGAQEFG